MHDGAEDGYLDEDKDIPSDPEDNLPLAHTVPSTPTPEEDHNQNEEHRPGASKKLVAGGKLYKKATNRKNEEPYFKLIKKDIIDSYDLIITLDNSQILQNSALAIKGKLLPGPKKSGKTTVNRAQFTCTFEFRLKQEAISVKEDYSDRQRQAKARQLRSG